MNSNFSSLNQEIVEKLGGTAEPSGDFSQGFHLDTSFDISGSVGDVDDEFRNKIIADVHDEIVSLMQKHDGASLGELTSQIVTNPESLIPTLIFRIKLNF